MTLDELKALAAGKGERLEQKDTTGQHSEAYRALCAFCSAMRTVPPNGQTAQPQVADGHDGVSKLVETWQSVYGRAAV